MLSWAQDAAGTTNNLLELYCGSSNFTLPATLDYSFAR
jgi:tRNA/tmRNA/rRNA uracil-C5-methylase (TrmA/RlmC/RlmD family)